MKPVILYLLSTCLALHPVFSLQAQNSSCPNSDFSNGTFDNWSAYYGYFENPAASAGIASGRHTIIKAPGSTDYHTCNQLQTVPIGSAYAAKLGNDEVDFEAEQLRYSVHVTQETNLFIYKYAVVLEDPGHDPELQPSFTIEVTNQSGQILDPVCGYYYVYAQQGLPNWHTCSEVIWKDWTTVGIDLSPYIGQEVSIVFTTRDCNVGGHFGYAYISAYCSKLQLLFGYCPEDTIATVTAPPGFSYQWNNGNTTQTTVIKNPIPGMILSCSLTSVNGCQVSISGTFRPTIVSADFSNLPTCDGTPMEFTNLTTINQNEITQITWDFGDSTAPLSTKDPPPHLYPAPGTYEVKLIAYSTDGCPDTIQKPVIVVKVPIVNFSIPSTCSLKNTLDTLYYHLSTDLSVEEGYDSYLWNPGDTTSHIHLTEEGWYSVTIENAGLCATTDSVNMVECFVDLFMPNAFTPNKDGKNDNFRPVTRPEKISNFRMIIFTRWGENIYETSSLDGWDGCIGGTQADMGVYVFYLTYEVPSGEKRMIQGNLTLLR